MQTSKQMMTGQEKISARRLKAILGGSVGNLVEKVGENYIYEHLVINKMRVWKKRGDHKQSIVIKDIAGQKHIIPVDKITSKKKQEMSLMPDPVNNGVSEQDLADIVQFLKEKR